METVLLLKVVQWGADVVGAANTKAQQRQANVLAHAAFLAAGLRHLDRRFVELFVPLTFYDPGTWTIDLRRARAEEIIRFMTAPDVIPRLAISIQWLGATPARDPQVASLVASLCETVRSAVWTGGDTEIPHAPADVPAESWLDGWRGRPVLMRTLHVRRQNIDVDDDSSAAVRHLVGLLRDEVDPPSGAIADAAAQCLSRGPSFAPYPGPHELEPEPSAIATWGESHQRPSDDDDLTWRMRATFSPVREFADVADAQFSTLLATIQMSFPGVPPPAWLWEQQGDVS